MLATLEKMISICSEIKDSLVVDPVNDNFNVNDPVKQNLMQIHSNKDFHKLLCGVSFFPEVSFILCQQEKTNGIMMTMMRRKLFLKHS